MSLSIIFILINHYFVYFNRNFHSKFDWLHGGMHHLELNCLMVGGVKLKKGNK